MSGRRQTAHIPLVVEYTKNSLEVPLPSSVLVLMGIYICTECLALQPSETISKHVKRDSIHRLPSTQEVHCTYTIKSA